MNQLAAQTNLSEEQVSSVLGNIAPALMSSLSAANTENVQANVQALEEKPASGGGLGSLLGGILGGGSSGGSSSGAASLLGSLFGGKQEKEEEAAVDGSSLLNLLMNMK